MEFGNALAPVAVEEIQGLYGAFTFPEKLLQRIWLRGDFSTDRAVTTDGQPVLIHHPGRWNLLGGPDFKAARLRIGGREVTGDVEVHLRAEDWTAHNHSADPAYDRVVLHVVLFPSTSTRPPVRTSDGRGIPTLVLIHLLHHDLEEYAADATIEALAARDDLAAVEFLGSMPVEECRQRLRDLAVQRWRQKVHFAALRIARLGWTEACHHAALEILGYRFNRTPMLKVAGKFPLSHWTQITEPDLDELIRARRNEWSVQGVRPANHPRHRLRQYHAWTRSVPDWPLRLESEVTTLRGDFKVGSFPTREARRRMELNRVKSQLATAVVGSAVGGTRLDNLVCDGFLPLLAARSREDMSAWWLHWFPGDLPPRVMSSLSALQIIDGAAWPSSHGFGQGLLGWWLEQEAAASGQEKRQGR